MNKERKIAIIRDELGYIGRYMDQINPKVSRYKELQERKIALQRRLKELKRK